MKRKLTDLARALAATRPDGTAMRAQWQADVAAVADFLTAEDGGTGAAAFVVALEAEVARLREAGELPSDTRTVRALVRLDELLPATREGASA